MGNYIDMTNWKMWEHGVPDSRWTVLKMVENKTGQKRWLCECSCENHTKKEIDGGELRRGKTKSCGCYRKEYIKKSKTSNIIGKQFGELTVIEDSGKWASDGSIYWRCKCSCGNENYLTTSSELNRTGIRQKINCNLCKTLSKGATKIKNLLDLEKINYYTEFSFEDLKGVNNRLYRFDFCIKENNEIKYLIEYDGRQHYNNNTWNFFTEEDFHNLENRDKTKNKYCIDNNYLLYRIPYYDIDKINVFNDIIQDKYLVKSEIRGTEV